MTDKAGENIIDARDAAESAGLVYVDDQSLGLTRRKSGKGWSYREATGAKISGKAVIERINRIGIPPAYTDVWICSDERGHIQATGRDAKGRKQYRYHERFREVRTARNTSTC
jgi:DNA topoisomerase-1